MISFKICFYRNPFFLFSFVVLDFVYVFVSTSSCISLNSFDYLLSLKFRLSPFFIFSNIFCFHFHSIFYSFIFLPFCWYLFLPPPWHHYIRHHFQKLYCHFHLTEIQKKFSPAIKSSPFIVINTLWLHWQQPAKSWYDRQIPTYL